MKIIETHLVLETEDGMGGPPIETIRKVYLLNTGGGGYHYIMEKVNGRGAIINTPITSNEFFAMELALENKLKN